MGLPRRDEKHHTYGDYLRWLEDIRYELIDGVAYLRRPAPGLQHQELVGGIYAQLLQQQLDKGPCKPLVSPIDVLLPKGEEADEQIETVVQPDVMVVCDPKQLSERGVRGAPDFIVEVSSPSTASHDHLLKRRLYELAGVKEFWLVHPSDRIATIYRLHAGEYGKPDVQELTGDSEIAVLPGAWDEIIARLPPVEH